MVKLSDNLGLEIPEPLDTVSRSYFEKLVTDIDKSVAGAEELSSLDMRISDNTRRLDSLGSTVARDIYAKEVKTDKNYFGSSKDVESALSKTSNKISTVENIVRANSESVAGHESRITKLEEESGSGGGGTEVPSTYPSSKITHHSKNISSTNVKDALEELFTYADDVHAKWASSVGYPLTKSDTAVSKEDKTLAIRRRLAGEVSNKGVPATASDSYDTLANKVGKIKVSTITSKASHYRVRAEAKTTAGPELNVSGNLMVTGDILGVIYNEMTSLSGGFVNARANDLVVPSSIGKEDLIRGIDFVSHNEISLNINTTPRFLDRYTVLFTGNILSKPKVIKGEELIK